MVTYKGFIEAVYATSRRDRGTEQRLLLRDSRDSASQGTLLLLLNMNETVNFVVGQSITVRGVLIVNTRQGLPTICPTAESNGYIRCNGRVVKWFRQDARALR